MTESDVHFMQSHTYIYACDQWKATTFPCTAGVQFITVVNPCPLATCVHVLVTTVYIDCCLQLMITFRLQPAEYFVGLGGGWDGRVDVGNSRSVAVC